MEEEDLDLIILYHRFIAEYQDRQELITSTLVDTGIPAGDSAMSRTVSLPAAIAAAMILDGKINMTGVYIPVQPEIYNPVLDELESMNLELESRVKERTQVVSKYQRALAYLFKVSSEIGSYQDITCR